MNIIIKNYWVTPNINSGQAFRQGSGGQALIALLMFVLMAVAVATAASFIIASNSLSASNIESGVIARQMADSGIEIAYLGFLRNQDSYMGEVLNLNGGTVTITISGVGTTKTITSVATIGNFSKTVESVITYSDNVLTRVSWKEIQ